MKPGWVFTSAPSKKGTTLCLMQTPERCIMVETPFEDDHIETMLMMANHCVRRGDTHEVSARVH